MRESTWKGFITGASAGLVACWAVARFYNLARETSSRHAFAPYCVGAIAGAAYGALVLGRSSNGIARLPVGAAVYLADPEHTAVPHGGHGVSEKAGNLALRMASRGLKKLAETAIHS